MMLNPVLFLHYVMSVCMGYTVLSATSNRWIFNLGVREEPEGKNVLSDFPISTPNSITLTSKYACGWFALRL